MSSQPHLPRPAPCAHLQQQGEAINLPVPSQLSLPLSLHKHHHGNTQLEHRPFPRVPACFNNALAGPRCSLPARARMSPHPELLLHLCGTRTLAGTSQHPAPPLCKGTALLARTVPMNCPPSSFLLLPRGRGSSRPPSCQLALGARPSLRSGRTQGTPLARHRGLGRRVRLLGGSAGVRWCRPPAGLCVVVPRCRRAGTKHPSTGIGGHTWCGFAASAGEQGGVIGHPAQPR